MNAIEFKQKIMNPLAKKVPQALEQNLVICKDDSGNYVLATRQVMDNETAHRYVLTIDVGRCPLVVNAIMPIKADIRG